MLFKHSELYNNYDKDY
jgi:hypothetical protein